MADELTCLLNTANPALILQSAQWAAYQELRTKDQQSEEHNRAVEKAASDKEASCRAEVAAKNQASIAEWKKQQLPTTPTPPAQPYHPGSAQ